MIIHRVWKENKAKYDFSYPQYYRCEGYYLFGVILLYKKEVQIN